MTCQHFYLEVQPGGGALEFRVETGGAGAGYRWGLWLTQLSCSSRSPLLAPPGCTQYYTSPAATIATFNWAGGAGQALADQHYRRDQTKMSQHSGKYCFLDLFVHFELSGSTLNTGNRICIKAQPGQCTVRLESSSQFQLSKSANFKTVPWSRAGVSSLYCRSDYLLVPGGPGGHDRHCGGRLASQALLRCHTGILFLGVECIYVISFVRRAN